MFEVRDLRCDFGSFRLDGISLEASDGDYHMLVGPCGSGKTLLLETIAGLHRPASGAILLDGRDITADPPEARRIGIVYQDSALFPHLTVEENVRYGLRFLPAEDRNAALETLEQVTAFLELDPLLPRTNPVELSGGERQKVALARSLITRPRLLLLDEPLASLDYPLRETVYQLLATVHREFGVPIVHVTHDHSEIWALGDTVTVLFAGRVLQNGSREEVFSRPASAYVARFLGAENILPVTVERAPDGGSRVRLGDHVLTVAPAEEAASPGAHLLVVRPERIRLAPAPTEGSTAGILVDLSQRGVWVRARIQVEEGVHVIALVPLERMPPGTMVGDRLQVGIEPGPLHLLPREDDDDRA